MHIKQLIIEGFKTYKDQVVVADLSPHTNAVLGKNGSGKSNIYDAIQFVLSDRFSALRTEERKTLLHEGSGREIMYASVEIIFDNSDSRIPIEREEVSLKRTIGLKKDEYFLDNKHIPKSEVTSLLESAGLSRSNPYYIVQQGQVRRLIKMKNTERLELLKEIAGTRTYDERRKESLKIMADSAKRRAQIEEVVSYIETRLKELEDERAELKKWQNLESRRRCLEYTVYDSELKVAEAKLLKIENNRTDGSEHTNQLQDAVAAVGKQRQDAEEEFKTLTEDLAKLKSQQARLKKDHRTAIKQREHVALQVKAAQDKSLTEEATRQGASDELAELGKKIVAAKQEMNKVSLEYGTKAEAEEDLKNKIVAMEQRLSALYDKQGRHDQFKDKTARDKFLKGHVHTLRTDLAADQDKLLALEQHSAELTAQLTKADHKAASLEKSLEKQHGKVDKLNSQFESLKAKRDDATNARKELWRAESKVGGAFSEYQTRLDRAQRKLQYTMSKDIFRGVEAVRRMVEDQKIKGVYGPLIELFSCEEAFRKCVETTAGNSLFHIVVDSEATASKIIKRLNRDKSGRVTFMPLQQLSHKDYRHPSSVDVIPMMEKLTFDPKFTKALAQVFGKTLITRDLAVASSVARTHNINTITIDGQQVNKKGALTGGYIDDKKSRLEAQLAITELKQKFASISAKADASKQELAEIDQRVTGVMGEMKRLQEDRTHIRRGLDSLRQEQKELGKSKQLLQQTLVQNAKHVTALEATIAQLAAKLKAAEEELASEMVEQLSLEDQQAIGQLNTELTTVKEALLVASAARAKVEMEKKQLENRLNKNLLRREEELTMVMSSQQAEETNDQLDREQHELKTLTDTISDLTGQLKEADDEVDKATSKSRKLQLEVEALKTSELAAEQTLASASKNSAKLMGQRAVLVQKKDDCTRKIRDLGTLPQEAFSDNNKLRSLTGKQLMSKLGKVNTKLKAYSHVNKKAIDQYLNFTDQRTNLLERKQELDKGRDAILNLIDHLDAKKDEAIHRTFKGIAKHFSTVFSELVPDGKGTLYMNKRRKGDDKGGKEERDSEDESEDKGTKQYSGVGIKVSFTGQSGNDMSMLQLSGGQQSVVALSLIFAIQRCDPSPFYLFDEIDSNLDAVHRTSVARMIQAQSEGTQFLCTTFRPEMLGITQKFYGVVFKNKTSRVDEITRDEAAQLILEVEKSTKKKK